LSGALQVCAHRRLTRLWINTALGPMIRVDFGLSACGPANSWVGCVLAVLLILTGAVILVVGDGGSIGSAIVASASH
jgi:hypothetical protein